MLSRQQRRSLLVSRRPFTRLPLSSSNSRNAVSVVRQQRRSLLVSSPPRSFSIAVPPAFSIAVSSRSVRHRSSFVSSSASC